MAESAAPFLHGGDSTRARMLDAVIGLLPAVAGAVWFFRLRGALLLLAAVSSCLAAEWAGGKLWRRGDLRDGSALVTGILLGLLLPAACPLWAAPLGALTAIGSKLLGGGLGKNILNPAAVGRAALMLLPQLRPAALRTAEGHFLMGYLHGSMAEVSSLLLLAGAVYLAIRRLLPPAVTTLYLLAAFFTGLCIPRCDPPAVLAWGGTLMGAAFLAADPVTSPMGRGLRIAYGLGCGAACTLAAYYGWGIGGVCGGMLLMNLLCRVAEWILWRTGH